MAIETLVAGVTTTFTSIMTTEMNTLASGNSIIGTTSVANATNLDLTAEFSFVGGGTITTTGSPFLGLYLYPLNGDGSTYGDGRFGSSTSGQPTSNYYRGFMGLPAATAIPTGYFGIPGTGIFQIPLPRGTWKPVLFNSGGVTLSSSGNILYYRTTNRQVM